jgi:magnesium chelatase family protein
MGRISGPLLDRMDLHVEVPRIQYEELKDNRRAETSESIRDRVTQARNIQSRRYAGKKINLNSQMTPSLIKKYCILDKESEQILKHAFNKFNMSARAHDRILKVARTIADLEASDNIKMQHIAEAIQYRSLDRKYWRNL